MIQELLWQDAGKPKEAKAECATPPSLLKWTGSKRACSAYIAKLLPGKGRYYEPFLGGGAVLYYQQHRDAVGSDIYKPLIDFWSAVKNEPEQIVTRYTEEWKRLQRSLPAHYYVVRERFNADPNAYDLCFLSRTCVNGIIRFNDEGKFNNSFHLSRRGMQPERFEAIVTAWSLRVRRVTFCNADYREILASAKRGDVVYMDPPYNGSQNRYIANLNVDGLVDSLESLNRRQVQWALSFDGARGAVNYEFSLPKELYRRSIDINTGNSAVHKVLNGPIETVTEKLYLNF